MTVDAMAQPSNVADSADALLDEGRKSFYHHRYDEALDLYHRAQALAPHNVEVICETAWALFQMGRYAESAEAAREGTLYQNTQIEELYALVNESYKRTITIPLNTEEMNQRPKEELASFIDFALQAEEGAELLYGLAYTFLDRRDSADALRLFELALSLQPDLYNAHLSIGLIYDNQGRYYEAALTYARLLSMAEDYAFASRTTVLLDNAWRRTEGDTVLATTAADVRPATPERLSRLLLEPASRDSVAERLYRRWLQEAADSGFIASVACRIARIDCEPDEAYRQWSMSYLMRSTRPMGTHRE